MYLGESVLLHRVFRNHRRGALGAQNDRLCEVIALVANSRMCSGEKKSDSRSLSNVKGCGPHIWNLEDTVLSTHNILHSILTSSQCLSLVLLSGSRVGPEFLALHCQ
jgi:hypothetical protein